MVFKEEFRDLFSVPQDYYLAHCISADFGMGKGIVVEFNKRFNLKQKLQNKYPNHLSEWLLNKWSFNCILEGRVFNLITKERYFHKPTYYTLTGALVMMRDICIKNNITKVAMPVIGCGLDRLLWNRVSNIIKEIFEETEIEILVCKQ